MDKIKRGVGRCIHYLWMSFAILTILLAVLVTLVKTVLPHVQEYKQDLERSLSKQIGLPVLIGAIDAEWKPLGPEIIINEVVVNDPKKDLNVLSVRVARVKINAWRSLINFSPYATLIELDSVVVNLSRSPQGAIHLTGLDPSEESDSDVDYLTLAQTLMDHLLAQSEILIKESRVVLTDESADNSKSTIAIREVSVFNKNSAHQILAKIAVASAGVMNIVAEFDGDPREDDANTNIYLKTSALDLAQLPIIKDHKKNLIKSAKLNTELWLNRSQDSWQNGFIKFSLDAIKYKNPEKQHIPIDSLSMSAQMRKVDKHRWFYSSNNLSLSADSVQLPKTRWQLNVIKEEQKTAELEWTLNGIAVEKIIQLISGSPYIDPGSYETLGKLALRGNVDSLTLSYNKHQNQLLDVDARFSQLGFKAIDDVPSMSNLSGFVDYRESQGVSFQLQSSDSQLTFNRLFRHPIPIGQLLVEGQVSKDGDALIIDVPLVKLQNQHTELNTKINLRVAEGQSTFMTLYSEIPYLDLNALSVYLPTGIMGDLLVKHLDNGFAGGRLKDVVVASHGNLKAFPYEKNNGYFAVHGKTDNTQYQFLESWPKINNLSTHIAFIKDRLEVNLIKGNMLAVPLEKVTALIPTMKKNQSKIIVDIENNGNFEDFNAIVNASPLADGLGQALDDLSLSKPLKLKLNITAGLSKGNDATHVDGKVILSNQDLLYKPLEITANTLNGTIAFTEKKVRTDGVTANLYREPARLHVKGDQSSDGMLLSIDINSAIAPVNLQRHIEGPWPVFLDGKIPLDVNVSIQAKRDRPSKVKTTVFSDLSGVDVFLPGEFAKTKEEQRPLNVQIKRQGEYLDVIMDYDKNLHSLVRLYSDNTDFFGAKIVFGEKMNRRIKPGLSVGGYLDTLKVDDWVSYFIALDEKLPSKKPQQQPSIGPIQVQVGQLQASDFTFKNVQVGVQTLPYKDIIIYLKNADMTGKVSFLRKADGPILVVDFERFVLNELPEFSDKESTAKPSDLLPMLVECGYCEVSGVPIGQVSLSGTPINLGYEFDGEVDLGDLFNFSFNGAWLIDGEMDLTSIRGAVLSDNIGDLIALWKLPGGIRNSDLNGRFNVFWPNKPFDMNVAQLGGSLTLEMGQGHLEQVSDAQARVFSLLSLSSIRRRLSLDFSDLFSKGFFYDSIKGEFYLENGWAKTDKATVLGAAANVEITGASDLVDKRYDQQVLIKPKIGSSLPVIAGWAVNPTLAITVLLLNEILEPQLDIVTSIEYKIAGSWDEPEVTKVGSNVDKIAVEDLKKRNQGRKVPNE